MLREKTVTVYCCDFCPEQREGAHHCSGCGKDTCPRCAVVVTFRKTGDSPSGAESVSVSPARCGGCGQTFPTARI